MEQKETKTIMNQVYNAIFSDIIHNEFDFDEYLTEKALMEKYNVSRAPDAVAQRPFYRLHSPSRIPHTQAGPAGAARYCKLPRCVGMQFPGTVLLLHYPRTYPVTAGNLPAIRRQTGQELY